MTTHQQKLITRKIHFNRFFCTKTEHICPEQSKIAPVFPISKLMEDAADYMKYIKNAYCMFSTPGHSGLYGVLLGEMYLAYM